MKKIQVIVNGLPGKMAWAVAEAVINSSDMIFLPRSLTGPETVVKNIVVNGVPVELFGPSERSFAIIEQADVVIDFTHPSAIVSNVEFYADNRIPFVMGTTGGDLDFIRNKVNKFGINAVVAPNMAKEVVLFQAMMEFAADRFPGGLKDFSLRIAESHQENKADTSGTAKAVVVSLNKLGIPFLVNQIDKKRKKSDYEAWGVPIEFWGGHGWHTYTLKKPDGSVFLEFKHNVNGRQAYIDGTLDAVRFLNTIEELPFDDGVVFSMTDVLRGQ